MSIEQLQKRYLEADKESQDAYVLGDDHQQDLWLDVRNAIGTVLRERDYQAWKILRRQRPVASEL